MDQPINLTSLPESLQVQFDLARNDATLAKADAFSSLQMASSDLARIAPEMSAILLAASMGKSQIVGTVIESEVTVDEHTFKVLGITVGRDVHVRTVNKRIIRGLEIR